MLGKIKVLGLGPGHPDYILPITKKLIEESQVIVGGRRNLDALPVQDKEIYFIQIPLTKVVEFIKSRYEQQEVAVVLSGDTGFYSLLTYLQKHFKDEELEVYPGISSIQYMFARIREVWQDAYINSYHGKEFNLREKLTQYRKIAFLTDNKWTPEKIARVLMEWGYADCQIMVGENLSYDNERIIKGTPEEIVRGGPYNMCVVVIINEKVA